MNQRPTIQRLCYWLYTLCLCIVWGKQGVWAQDYNDLPEVIEEETEPFMIRGATLQVYRLHPYIIDIEPAFIDTLALNLHHRAKPEGRSIAMGYTGNFASPWQDKDFFQRRPTVLNYPFNSPLTGLVYTPENYKFYHTKAPYTRVMYNQHGKVQQREGVLDVTLALNPNRHLGVGGDFNYAYSSGHYASSNTQNTSYRLFAHWDIDRYQAWITAGRNHLKIVENGGISDDRFITNPAAMGSSNLKSQELPMKYGGQIWNGVVNSHIKLAHRYNLGKYKPREVQDSLTLFLERRPPEDSLRFVPIAALGHIVHFQHARHDYVNRNTQSLSAYPKQYTYARLDDKTNERVVSFLPFDSTYMWQLDNSLQLSLREGFKPWVKFGIDAFVTIQNKHYYQQADSLQGQVHFNAFNTLVGGRISKKQGRKLTFQGAAQFVVLGEDIGSLLVEGEVGTQWLLARFPIELKAYGWLSNQRPHFFVRHFHGSFHQWDKEWNYQRNLLLGGSVIFPSIGTTLSVHSATLQNHIYFAPDALPVQYPGAIQVLSAGITHQYHWGILGWDLGGLYQLTSHSEALPLPALSLHGKLYLDFYTARVMRTQIGTDCSWHTAYYTPYYEPATMQFVNQRSDIYGGFPLLNIFANFKLQRARFFLEYYNLGQLFITQPGAFSLAHYPMLPAGLRMGIVVDFFN